MQLIVTPTNMTALSITELLLAMLLLKPTQLFGQRSSIKSENNPDQDEDMWMVYVSWLLVSSSVPLIDIKCWESIIGNVGSPS